MFPLILVAVLAALVVTADGNDPERDAIDTRLPRDRRSHRNKASKRRGAAVAVAAAEPDLVGESVSPVVPDAGGKRKRGRPRKSGNTRGGSTPLDTNAGGGRADPDSTGDDNGGRTATDHNPVDAPRGGSADSGSPTDGKRVGGTGGGSASNGG